MVESSRPLDHRPVLLATDGSRVAARAREVAVDICRRSGAPLHLVHVWGLMVAPRIVATATPAEDRDHLRRLAHNLAASESAAVTATGVPVAGCHVVEDTPAPTVLMTALRLNAALIVMGNRGLGAVRRAVLGTVSEEVVHRGGFPVLVVHEQSPWPPSRVVVGDDGSAEAARASVLGAQLARALGAEVVLVHGTRGHAVPVPAVPPTAWLAERAAALEASQGCRVSAEVLDEDALDAISHAVGRGHGPALVVIGAGAHPSHLTHRGSISTHLLRHLPHPVLVVPPPPPPKKG